MRLPEDAIEEMDRAYEQFGEKPETVTWNELINDLAPRIGMTPDELARKSINADRAQITRELTALRAVLRVHESRVARLTREVDELQNREDQLTPEEQIQLGQLRADLEQQKVREMLYWLAARRLGGEAGRALNSLRMVMDGVRAGLVMARYQASRQVIDEIQRDVQRDSRRGQLSDDTRRRLEALEEFLVQEEASAIVDEEGAEEGAERRPGSTSKRAPRRRRAGSNESLAREIVRINRQIIAARREGQWDRFDQLREERDRLMESLDERLQESIRRRLRRLEREKPDLTPEEAEAQTQELLDVLEGRAARRIISQRRRAMFQREMGEGEMLARVERDVQRQMNRELVRDALRTIDRLLDQAPRVREVRTEVDTLLRYLSTLSGEADDMVRRYRARKAQADVRRLLPKDVTPQDAERVALMLAREDWTDPRAVGRVADLLAKPTLWSKFHTYRVASMLSGPATLLLNAMGNTIETGLAPVQRIAAAIPEEIAVRAGRKPTTERTASARMATAELEGMVQGLPVAIQEFMQTIRTGISARQIRHLPRYRSDQMGILGYPLRVMAATDDFFYALNYAAALRAHATLEAQRKRVSVEDILLNPMEHPEVVERASENAGRRTYTQRLQGSLANVERLRSNPAGMTLVPFFSTVARLTKIGIEMSGAGFYDYHKLKKTDPIQAQEMAGAAITGVTFGLTVLALLAPLGLITAYGPSDEDERRDWLDQGGQPYSIRIPFTNTWVSYTNWGSLAIPLAFYASLYEAAQEGMSRPNVTEAITTFFTQALTRSANLWLNMTALRSTFNFLLGVVDSNQTSRLERFGEQFVTSLVPFGGLLANIARATDPHVRSPENVVEAILARLPVLSRNVAPIRTQFGEPRTRDVTGPGAYLPFYVREQRDDPLLKEFQRLRRQGYNVNVGEVGGEIEGIRLRPSEQQEYQRVAGQLSRQYLERLTGSAFYRNASSDRQARLLEYAVSQARQWARLMMLRAMFDAYGADEVRRRYQEDRQLSVR